MPFGKTNAKIEPENEIVELNTKISNIKVLVAEDIALNQLLMKTILDDFGFECDIAENGKIAIEKLKTGSYDIVLMDLQMPAMNGFEATEYIRNELNSDIPIIALTADVTTVDLDKCKFVGMNDYLAKPADEKLLYSKIISLVKNKFPVDRDLNSEKIEGTCITKNLRCTDLAYLNRCTKSNPAVMMEMISLYLEQTPMLVNKLKQGVSDEDWNIVASAVHKMIPSFLIVGIHKDYENAARKIQEFTLAKQHLDEVPELVNQLDIVCAQACLELQESYNLIKKQKNG